MRKDGTEFPMELKISRFTQKDVVYSIGFFFDLTTIIRAQSKAEETETLLNAIVQNTKHLIWVVDPQTNAFLFFNDVLQEYFLRYSHKQLLPGMKPEDIFQNPEIVRLWHRYYERVLTEKSFVVEIQVPNNPIWLMLHLTCLERDGKVYGIAVIGEDISYRKEIETTLRESEERFRTLSENAMTGIYIIQNSKLTYVNPAIMQIFGYPEEELIGSSPIDFFHLDDKPLVEQNRMKRDYGETGPIQYEARIIQKDGTVKHIEIRSIQIQINDMPATIGNLIDITGRIDTLNQLRVNEEFFRTSFENANIGAAFTSIDGRFMQVNKNLCDTLGYSREELIARPFVEFTYAPDREIGVDFRKRILRGEIDNANFEKRYVTKSGEVLWFLVSVGIVRDISGTPEYFVTYLQNITDRVEAETSLNQSYQKLNRALYASVQALGYAIEQRDPYTSGHQQRIADLAVAIAQSLKLSVETIEGIRISSLIHDIGKISIPFDLLSKPTKLTDLEMSLIKLHVEHGVEIIGKIQFPWPVADIILQHHERMNGSGYPRGITGEQMLIEAKIIAVADVVEAMSSHRPYRPALGIEAALDEISKYRSVLYDASVVDVCVELFHSGGFEFSV